MGAMAPLNPPLTKKKFCYIYDNHDKNYIRKVGQPILGYPLQV